MGTAGTTSLGGVTAGGSLTHVDGKESLGSAVTHMEMYSPFRFTLLRITAFNTNQFGAVVTHLVYTYILYPIHSTYVLYLYAGRPLVLYFFFYGYWSVLSFILSKHYYTRRWAVTRHNLKRLFLTLIGDNVRDWSPNCPILQNSVRLLSKHLWALRPRRGVRNRPSYSL